MDPILLYKSANNSWLLADSENTVYISADI